MNAVSARSGPRLNRCGPPDKSLSANLRLSRYTLSEAVPEFQTNCFATENKEKFRTIMQFVFFQNINPFFFFLLAAPAACARSRARDQTCITEAT